LGDDPSERLNQKYNIVAQSVRHGGELDTTGSAGLSYRTAIRVEQTLKDS
jgi:hypothetical protein